MDLNENMKEVLDYMAQKDAAPINQLKELEKQTDILDKAKKITVQNAEYVKQIAEYTKRNEISSKRQFTASFIISLIALVIAILSFCQPIKIDEQQFNQLLNRINREEITQQQQSNQKVSTEIDSNVLIQQTVTHKMKHK